MLKIGDFARLSRVPVKTLRYYDEIGLLAPSQIDRYTRYRYYWELFNQRAGEIRHVDPTKNAAYGVCSPHPEGLVDYVAALPVKEAAHIPPGMVSREIPAQTYVVFEAHGVSDIGPTYSRILKDWLPSSGYRPGEGPDFEYYPPEFDPDQPDAGIVYIYFPVQKGEAAQLEKERN